MTTSDYADMVEVMQCARSICEALYVSLEHKGLIDKGFRLNLYVGDFKHDDQITETARIELETAILEDDERWQKTRMYQRRTIKEGWMIDNDPLAEEGTVPPVVTKRKTCDDDRKGTGETSSKPYPVDGLWLSSRDDPSYVDGGQ